MNLDLTPLLTSLSIIFLAELGDKTQICVITLSSRASATSVFLGSMGAFFIVDGLSAFLGGELLSLLPKNIIGIISGIIFIVFGLIPLIRGEKSKSECEKNGVSLLRVFSLISLMELGDKTQIFSILLVAQFKSPLTVLVGIMLAFTIVTGMGVLLGQGMLRIIPERYLRNGAAVIFIVLGLIQIVETLFNISILS